MENNIEFNKIQQIIADVMGIDASKITMESSFLDDLGADSLDLMQIITNIEDDFKIQIPDDALDKITTVADAVNQLKSNI